MRRCHWDPSSILFIGHHQNDERHHGTLLQFCHGNDPSLISTAANDGKLIHSFEQSALEVQNVALRLDAKLQLVLDSSGYYYYYRLPWLRNYKKFTVPLPPLNSPVRNTNLTIWTIINYQGRFRWNTCWLCISTPSKLFSSHLKLLKLPRHSSRFGFSSTLC